MLLKVSDYFSLITLFLRYGLLTKNTPIIGREQMEKFTGMIMHHTRNINT